jgi:hypothetical protein
MLQFYFAARWINPLMGWTSTSDPLENVSRAALQFYTKVRTAQMAERHQQQQQYSSGDPSIGDLHRSENIRLAKLALRRHLLLCGSQ